MTRVRAELQAFVLCMAAMPVVAARAADSGTAQAHFDRGVELFEKGKYDEASQAFLESHRIDPSASTLQNLALCYTRLGKHGPAVQALEALLLDFGSSLSPEDRTAVERAIAQLSQRIGRVQIELSPPIPNATLQVDGSTLEPRWVGRPLPLSPGEHRVTASAPLYVSIQQDVTVTASSTAAVKLELVPVASVSVKASDPMAGIALDRQPLAFGSWAGAVSPGDHLVQVYKDGHAPSHAAFEVRHGESVELMIPLGPRFGAKGATSYVPPASPPPQAPYLVTSKDRGATAGPSTQLPPQTGWYVLATATNLALRGDPDSFQRDDDADATGAAFGARGGYRFGANVGLEALFDAGGQTLRGRVDNTEARQEYDLTSIRFGGNARFMTGGKTVRLSGTLGAGGVVHKLRLSGHTYSGTNSYFALEIGPQVNLGHVLLGLDLQAIGEGTTNVRNNEGTSAYTDETSVAHVGIGLRVGYSHWGTW